MATAVLDDKTTGTEASVYETPEEAKARRNAEYLAKLERGIRELDDGKGITMTFEEWERRFTNE